MAGSLREWPGQCTCKHWDRAKVVGSMSALAHQFPPPSSSVHLCWLDGQGVGCMRFLSQSLFLDWGTVLQTPSDLYTVDGMNKCSAHAVSAPSLPVQRCPEMLEMTGSENVLCCPCMVMH